MTYGDVKDLTSRTASDKMLRDKEFISVDLIQQSLNLFKKKKIKNENETISNHELTEELHKPIIRKIKKRKI